MSNTLIINLGLSSNITARLFIKSASEEIFSIFFRVASFKKFVKYANDINFQIILLLQISTG